MKKLHHWISEPGAAPRRLRVPASGWAEVQAERQGGATPAADAAPAGLWLTIEGELDDHVLRAGERLYLHAGQRVWLSRWQQAQPAVRLVLQPGQA